MNRNNSKRNKKVCKKQKQDPTKEPVKVQSTKQDIKNSSFLDLPPELICEIADHNPGSITMLALTCKALNVLMRKQLAKIQEIAENNRKIHRETAF